MEKLIELTKKISESYSLKMSMVNYVPGLLAQYARGEITKDKLFTEYIKQTREKQFYYFHMPKTQIEESQRLFNKEFVFANGLSRVIQQYARMEEEAFNASLEKCMEDYLQALSEGTKTEGTGGKTGIQD